MVLNPQKLNLAMARACLTSRELQIKAGISDSSLSHILSGKQKARPLTIGKIAKALGVDPVELIEEAQS